MRLLVALLGLWACAWHAGAALPEYRIFPASGERVLLWVSSERGHAEPETEAARKLAEQGVAVWALDPVEAYFLAPQPNSMEAVPVEDVRDWLDAALSTSRRPVVVYAVARAALPVLRATARLDAARRARLCVLLMYPNLYASADALADAAYLDPGRLDGMRVRVLQPRRSAATPWLPGLLDHLGALGATVSYTIMEDLREGYWARETPTDHEIAESRRMDALLLRELETWGCK